jgi:hypothetical protein
MARERLPELMDERMIAAETGLPESTCRGLMQRCTMYELDGFRRRFVKRQELLEKLRPVPRPPERAR